MEGVRIVKLGNNDVSVQTVSFEEAFGDFSEARGKGRARRKKRKLERIANRKEVTSARQEARKERKVGRQEVKQATKEARVRKRRTAQEARQDKRGAAMEARQERRTKRKGIRLKRKELGDTETDMDDQTAVENGEGVSEQEQPTETGSVSNEGGAAEGEWGGTGSVYSNDNEDLGGSGEGTGTEEDETEEEGAEEEETEESEDSQFDGVMGAEDRFFEFTDGDGVKITPAVADTAKKVEWNKEFLSRLMAKKAKIQGVNGDASDVSKQIEIRKRRVADLENQLTKFANAEGDFVSDGEEFSFADGSKLASPAVKRGRARQVLKAKGMAMRERRKVAKGRTPVAKGLSPQFSTNRIVVPASEASSYTGLNGIDLQDDYDAPETRIIELQSNAEGAKKKINWTGIAIGAAIAVGAIWAIRKYKIFAK